MAIDKKFDDYQTLKLKNVTVRWAKVQPEQFDSYKGGPKKWKADIMINDKLGANLKKEGFNVKGKKGEFFIVPVRNHVNATTNKANKPITIVGLDGKTPVTEDLGNGTECNINLSAKNWDTGFISLYWEAIQVTKLVEYSGSTGFDDMSPEDDGSEPDFG